MHKPPVYVANVLRPEDNSGQTAAVLWPYGAGGTQQNHSATQYMHQHNTSLFCLHQILEKNVKISKQNIGFSFKGDLL